MWIKERKVMHAELEEVRVMMKTAYDRCAVSDKEILSRKKHVKDLAASSKQKVQDTIEGAKHSAVMAILHAKIQMAIEAGDKGIEIWKEDLESWNAVLEKIMKEKTVASVGLETLVKGDDEIGTSKGAGDDEQKEEIMVVAIAGDEGYNN